MHKLPVYGQLLAADTTFKHYSDKTLDWTKMVNIELIIMRPKEFPLCTNFGADNSLNGQLLAADTAFLLRSDNTLGWTKDGESRVN